MINLTLYGMAIMLRLLWHAERNAPFQQTKQQAAGLAAGGISGLGGFGHNALSSASLIGNPDPVLDTDNVKSAIDLMNWVNEYCISLELAGASERVRIILLKLELAISYAEYETELRVLRETIEFELKESFCYYYPKAKAALLRRIPADWKATNEKFKTARRDIAAAVDCYASGQNTACVFHLMRIAEYGLRALARERRVRLPKQRPIEWATWEAILQQLDKEVKKVANRKPGPARTKALEFYQGALGEFGAFKDVYRNEVMHAREFYDEHRALSVLLHVREFMERLSSRIGEESTGAIAWTRNP
jgi:hypothetical protein